MRSRFTVSSLLAFALIGSSAGALAQTGEFANQPPGSVVHRGYALQDWWQSQLHGVPDPAPIAETSKTPAVLAPGHPGPAVANKATGKVTTNRHVQPKPSLPQ